MILYIVRHAIAEAAGTSDYEDDSARCANLNWLLSPAQLVEMSV